MKSTAAEHAAPGTNLGDDDRAKGSLVGTAMKTPCALRPAGRVGQAATRTAVTPEAATFTNVCKH